MERCIMDNILNDENIKNKFNIFLENTVVIKVNQILSECIDKVFIRIIIIIIIIFCFILCYPLIVY